MRRLLTLCLRGLAVVALVFGLWRLEAERVTVRTETLGTAAGPVTLYRAGDAEPQGLVVVSHGFAGSRQMMQYLARDLARAGFLVASFDYIGHGRNGALLSPDVTRIEGTTRQLVGQTLAVTEEVRAATGYDGPMAHLGHSMATDIIIRAAETQPDVAAIVAISMYSEAITPTFPERLLVLSGAWEGRLREAGLRAARQIDPEAEEGETVRQGEVVRRTVAVPETEHVAVLFAAVTLEETRDWLLAALPGGRQTATLARGPEVLMVLLALVILIVPTARLLPQRTAQLAPLPARRFLSALAAPVLPAVAAAMPGEGALLGMAGFGRLAVFLGVWGGVVLAVLWRAGRRPGKPGIAGVALLLFGALAFALALDRYAAAFLPAGPRLPLMVLLIAGTLPFALADRLLVAGAPLWQRGLARLVPVAALAGAMVLRPESFGLLFTVLPVLVLFFAVYGTMARAVAQRAGPESAACAQAIILAWAIAASTPLFAAG